MTADRSADIRAKIEALLKKFSVANQRQRRKIIDEINVLILRLLKPEDH